MYMGDLWGGGGGCGGEGVCASIIVLYCERVQGLLFHFPVFCGLHCGGCSDFYLMLYNLCIYMWSKFVLKFAGSLKCTWIWIIIVVWGSKHVPTTNLLHKICQNHFDIRIIRATSLFTHSRELCLVWEHLQQNCQITQSVPLWIPVKTFFFLKQVNEALFKNRFPEQCLSPFSFFHADGLLIVVSALLRCSRRKNFSIKKCTHHL